jgi:hypothetical protein
MAANQTNDAMKQDRINIILEMLFAAYRRSEIIKFIKKKDADELIYKSECETNNTTYVPQWLVWNVNERAIDYYIAAAKKEIDTFYEKHKDTILNTSIARLNNLYKKAYSGKDYRLAKDVVKDLVSITGNDAPTKSEVTGANGKPLFESKDITTEQALTLLNFHDSRTTPDTSTAGAD